MILGIKKNLVDFFIQIANYSCVLGATYCIYYYMYGTIRTCIVTQEKCIQCYTYRIIYNSKCKQKYHFVNNKNTGKFLVCTA